MMVPVRCRLTGAAHQHLIGRTSHQLILLRSTPSPAGAADQTGDPAQEILTVHPSTLPAPGQGD
jgi:hypothetical protein